MSALEELKCGFRIDIENAGTRIGKLNSVIPQLKKEREQLKGMIAVMEKVLAKEEQDDTRKPKDNGHEQDSAERSSNG